jgi:hypothetical protein
MQRDAFPDRSTNLNFLCFFSPVHSTRYERTICGPALLTNHQTTARNIPRVVFTP